MVKASALVLLLPALLAATPTIDRPVTDTQGLLSSAQTETVARELVRLREETGVQMAVLIVGTTEGEPIEDYSIRVAHAWRGGQGGSDNGLLYVLAVKDRRMRLEVGYGLEEHLPDDAVRRLLDAQGPLMRERDYTGALVNIIHGVRERLPANGAVKTQAPAEAARAAPSASRSVDPGLEVMRAVALGSFTGYVLCLLLCIVRRPGLCEWLGEWVVSGISGVLIILALLFLFVPARQPGPTHLTTVAWFFCIYCVMVFGARTLVLRDGWERWGISALVGLFLGGPITWAMVREHGEARFFYVLIPFFFSTLFVAFFSLFPLFGHILRGFVYVLGGASSFSSWSKEESATYGSRSTPRPSSWTSGSSSRPVWSPPPSSSVSDASSSDASSSGSPSLFASLWSSSSSDSSSSSSSDSSSSFWGSSSSTSSSDSSSSSIWDSSSSSSSSDSSSSSSSSDWSGGGGDFGGGGSSSSW